MERSTIFKNGKPSISIRAIEKPWQTVNVITRLGKTNWGNTCAPSRYFGVWQAFFLLPRDQKTIAYILTEGRQHSTWLILRSYLAYIKWPTMAYRQRPTSSIISDIKKLISCLAFHKWHSSWHIFSEFMWHCIGCCIQLSIWQIFWYFLIFYLAFSLASH